MRVAGTESEGVAGFTLQLDGVGCAMRVVDVHGIATLRGVRGGCDVAGKSGQRWFSMILERKRTYLNEL